MNHRKPTTFFDSANREIATTAEAIYHFYRHKLFEKLNDLKQKIKAYVSGVYSFLPGWDYQTASQVWGIERLHQGIRQYEKEFAHDVCNIVLSMARRVFVISFLGDIYIYEKLGKKPQKKLEKSDIEKKVSEPTFDAFYSHRAEVAVRSLFSGIENEIDRSLLFEDKLSDIFSRIEKCFGNIVRTREAKFFVGTIDQDEIDEIVDEIRAASGWKTRARKHFVRKGKSGFEFERDIKTEFVRVVRSGRIEAANVTGVNFKDYIWVAVIDKKTCEDCCLPRHGLTMTEIKRKFRDDTAPPLHYNCRCELTPAPEFLDDIWDGNEIEAEGFEEWLEKQKLSIHY